MIIDEVRETFKAADYQPASSHEHWPEPMQQGSGEGHMLYLTGRSDLDTATFGNSFACINSELAEGILNIDQNFCGALAESSDYVSGLVVAFREIPGIAQGKWEHSSFGQLLGSVIWEESIAENAEVVPRRTVVIEEEALRFASEQQLFAELKTAVSLADDSFDSILGFEVEVECDPESHDQWLLLTARVRGDVAEILRQYNQYTLRFVQSIPWPKRSKICFNYDLT